MKSLFPAYGKIPATSQENNDTNYSWLQNASFTTQHVDLLSPACNSVSVKDGTNEQLKAKDKEDERSRDPADQHAAVDVNRHSRRHKKTTKHKRKRSRSRSDSRSKSPSLEILILKNKTSGHSKKVFIEDVGLNPEHAFFVDRKSDRNNLAFATFAHNHVAKYHRRLPCLDASWALNESLGKVVKTSTNRYYLKYKLYCDDSNVLDLTKAKVRQEDSAEIKRAFQDTYLPISTSTTEFLDTLSNEAKMKNVSNPLGIYDSSTSLYFEGKGIDADVVSDTNALLDKNVYIETHEQYLTRLTGEFNKNLRDNPHDVKQWLEFVNFQDQIMDSTRHPDFAIVSKHEKVTEALLLEKKVAILDKAIESNPKSVDLLSLKYDLCKDLWDTDKLMKEWKKALFLHPNNTWLWQKYLMFLQTRFSAFSVTKFAKLYNKCFDMLKKIHEGSFQSHKPLPRMEENMLDIFNNYCRLLYQSGYHERAIANFQALIEFNFFAPEQLQRYARLDDWLAFFEPFWDSGNPRFGEEQAVGWCNAMKNKESQSIAKQNLENEDCVVKLDNPKWKNWLDLEKFRERHHWLPWRATDMDDDCEDPDRMVLFDDVSPSLFLIKTDHFKFILLVRFLEMLGVKIAPHYQSTCRYLNCHNPNYITESWEILDGSRHFKWRFYTSDRTSNMFSLEPLFSELETYHNFINQVFQQSYDVLQQPYKKALTLLWINHHYDKIRLSKNVKSIKNQLKSPKKFLKNMLKIDENRNDLVLWTLYAKLEWLCNNYEEARKIFNLALITHSEMYGEWRKMDIQQQSALCRTYKTYAELELGYGPVSENSWKELSGNATRGLLILVSLGCDAKYVSPSEPATKLPPSQILKARQHYMTILSELMNIYSETEVENVDPQQWFNDPHILLDWTVCYALFEYLTEGLLGFSSIFENVLQFFKSKFCTENIHGRDPPANEVRNWSNCEFLYMHYIQLYVYHDNNCPSQPVPSLKKVLHDALELFPENQHFNNLFLDIEAKACLSIHLRSHYNSVLKFSSLPSCTSAVFAIVAEVERQKNIINSVSEASHIKSYESLSSLSVETGIIHRLRVLFEKLVNHPNLRHCVLIWRLYLKFETMQPKAKEAKAVFYRALQQCPWAKILYLDAVQQLPDDVQEISDIMTEKAIRIRAPLEEIALLMESNEIDSQEDDLTGESMANFSNET